MTNSVLFDKVYSKLKDEANKSPILYKHCAAILKHKKIIGKPCCNNYGCVHNDCSLGSVHAEVNAIFNFFGKDVHFDHKNRKWTISCKSKNLRKKIDVVVIRINHNGDTVNSRPCYNCLKMMQDIEIQNVFYSTGSNGLICERVKDMISIQSSHASRLLYCSKYKIQMTDSDCCEKILKSSFPNNVKRYNLSLFLRNNDISNHLIIVDDDKVIIKNIQGNIVLTSYIV